MSRVTVSSRQRLLRAVVLLLIPALLVAIDLPLADSAAAARSDTAMVVRGRTWIVRSGATFTYGRTGDVQLMGDWNGDGVPTPGVFRAGRWYLRNRLTSGSTEVSLRFGKPGDVPVVGDWDRDGRTTIGSSATAPGCCATATPTVPRT